MRSASRLRVLSPAKINLHLRVGAVRSDGFHPLQTWMVSVGLFDSLDFLQDEVAAASVGRAGSSIALRSSDPALQCDDNNLIVQAAEALRAAAGDKAAAGFSVDVAKAIPMGGGLGGGSSNAAATLSALNTLWALGFGSERLCAIGARLGSDVPFFLGSASAICSGRGDQVLPVTPPLCRWAVLMLPDFPLSTAAVYRQLDVGRSSSVKIGDFFDSSDALLKVDPKAPAGFAAARLDATTLLPKLVNDLEVPAFSIRPELGHMRDTAENAIGQPVRMSGSGSTLFTLFDIKARAETAREEISRRLAVKSIVVRIAP